MHGADRLQPEPGSQHPVEGGRGTAALDVPEYRAAGLLAGALLDLVRQHLADADHAQPYVAERVQRRFVRRQAPVYRAGALGHHDDRGVPRLEPVLHVIADLLDVELLLRDQDDVGAAGHSRMQRDPARVPAHHLDDQRPVVAFRRGVQPVDGLHRDVHGGVEPEGVVGRAQVVVDGLGYAHDLDALVVQPRGTPQGVLPTDRDQRADAQAVQVIGDPRYPGATAAGRGVGQRIRSRRAEDRAAERQDAADGLHVQRDGVALQRAAPAVPEPDEFVIELLRSAADDGADDRVQPGAVTATGENSDSHYYSLSCYLARHTSPHERAGNRRGNNWRH